MAERPQVLDMLDGVLEPWRFKDYTINGLQVEGAGCIARVMGGVTASEALIDEAIAWQADTLLVHHGYFWKNEPARVTGMTKRRLAKLLAHDINVLAYPLPLDAHPEFGNNIQLARQLGWTMDRVLDGPAGQGLLYSGYAAAPVTHEALAESMTQVLGREPLVLAGHERPISRIAWCTGGRRT